MHATGHTDRSGGGGGSWRLPPDETLQVADPKNANDEEFYPGDSHNWRSIVFSLIVIAAVIAGICTAIYTLGYVDELLYWSGRRMRLEEFLRGDLVAERLPTVWVNSHQLVYQADDGGLAVLNVLNNSVTLLVTNHTLCLNRWDFYTFLHLAKACAGAGGTYSLTPVPNGRNVCRMLIDLLKAIGARLCGSLMCEAMSALPTYATYFSSTTFKSHHIPLVGDGALQHATWLGAEGAILFLCSNDIFVQPSPPAPKAAFFRLTFTGRQGEIYNGVPDWLYQEEVTKSSSAVWGSPDGRFVLYAEYNDSSVATLSFPWLTGPVRKMPALSTVNDTSSPTFPDHKTVRYPLPGTPNPKVRVWIVVVENSTAPVRWEVTPPETLLGQDIYLISAQWVGLDNNHVATVWMNRAQNLTVVSSCFKPNWTCAETHREQAKDLPWLEAHLKPVYSKDGSAFLFLASVREGGDQHYTHIKHVSVTRQRQTFISHGKVEVMEILAWDQDSHTVYYLGSGERPGQRHLYVVRDPGYSADSNSVKQTADQLKRRDEPKCLTCDETAPAILAARLYYSNCSYWRAVISNPAKYYALECSGPGLPLAGLHDAQTHALEKIIYDNELHRSTRLKELALPLRRCFEVQLDGGSRAHVQLYLPPSWREELRDALFPVLFQVDGRPGSQQVSDEWVIDWGAYMSSRNDIVYVKLDVTGARSLPSLRLRSTIGGAEVTDQTAVINYLLDTFIYLDRTRVAVWGWGYGGYVTTMLLSSQQNTLKCGIAVAPIVDWLYYNSAFTERILGEPLSNYKGYVDADATKNVQHLAPHSLFILHGLADLSVPYQHAFMLTRALTEAGILFGFQVYPDEGHSLSGVKEHAYKSMENFLNTCLNLDPEDTKLPPPNR